MKTAASKKADIRIFSGKPKPESGIIHASKVAAVRFENEP